MSRGWHSEDSSDLHLDMTRLQPANCSELHRLLQRVLRLKLWPFIHSRVASLTSSNTISRASVGWTAELGSLHCEQCFGRSRSISALHEDQELALKLPWQILICCPFPQLP